MYTIKSLITAFLLVGLLPWCGISAASAATGGVVRAVQDLNLTSIKNETDIKEARFTAPSKAKRIAVLQAMSCGFDAPLLSGINQNIAAPKDVQSIVGNPRLIQHRAQAPPTSPPRSI